MPALAASSSAIVGVRPGMTLARDQGSRDGAAVMTPEATSTDRIRPGRPTGRRDVPLRSEL